MKKPRTAAVAGLLLMLVLFGPGTYELIRLHVMEYQLDRRLVQVSAQQQQLLQEHQRLTSDPTYVEGLIRSTFKVARPDEMVVTRDDSSLHDD